MRGRGGLDVVNDLIKVNEWAHSMASIAHDALFCEDDEREVTPTEFKHELERRIMPEGMEWPMVDGKPVDFTTGYEPSLGVLESVSIYSNGACEVMSHDGIIKSVKDIHVSKPKALDADGVEIHEGDTVYLLPGDWCDKFPCLGYHGGEELVIFSLHVDHVDGGIGCRDTRRPKGTCYPQPSQLTHRAPAIAADGRPLREGETVWDVETGGRYTVERIYSGTTEPDFPGHNVACRRPADVVTHMFEPSQLTHERPDSWERLEEDAGKDPCKYFVFDEGVVCSKCPASGKNCEQTMARDIVRRAKALAERGR